MHACIPESESETTPTTLINQRIHNAQPGLIVAWGALQSPKSPQAHVGLVGVFALCRCVLGVFLGA